MVTSGIAGRRVHGRRIEEEVVRVVSIRSRSRGPVITVDAGVAQVLKVRTDVPAADEAQNKSYYKTPLCSKQPTSNVLQKTTIPLVPYSKAINLLSQLTVLVELVEILVPI